MEATLVLVTLRNAHIDGVFQASSQFGRKRRDGGRVQPERSTIDDRVDEMNFV